MLRYVITIYLCKKGGKMEMKRKGRDGVAMGGRRRRGRKKLAAVLAIFAIVVAGAFVFVIGGDKPPSEKSAAETPQREVFIAPIEDDDSAESQGEHWTTETAVKPGEGKTIYYDDQ
jgi:hypothetical protein